MNNPRLPAVILAGGKAGDRLAVHAGVAYKALVPVGGRPMVAFVADALQAAQSITELVLVGPPEVAAAVPGARHVPDAGSFLGNISAGVAACGHAPFCLLTTCDIPCVTGSVIDAFVVAAATREVDLAYPVVELALCQARFPGMHRTSLRLREGRFTGGNAVLVRPSFLARNSHLIEQVFAARKDPIRLAGMIGWETLGRVLLARWFPSLLSLPLLEARVGRLLGASVAAVQVPHPEIGADVDRPEDLCGVLPGQAGDDGEPPSVSCRKTV
ncbi:MAG: nucleotidyltransferase family protein [Armatimonadota bacterium]|jgi:molybdopterin-guanine dinucleotide biosynthesis protein A|nr:nucleotidyltransferase family protein [Armatimonadota bacterium]